MHFLTLRDLQSNFKPPSIPIPPLEGEARRGLIPPLEGEAWRGPSSCLVIIPRRIRRSVAGDMLRHVTKRQGFGTHRLDIVGSILFERRIQLSSVSVQVLLLTRSCTHFAIDNLTHFFYSFFMCFAPIFGSGGFSPRKQRRCFGVSTPLSGPLYAVVLAFLRRCRALCTPLFFHSTKVVQSQGALAVFGGHRWGEPSAVAGTTVRQGRRCLETCERWFHVSGSKFQATPHPSW